MNPIPSGRANAANTDSKAASTPTNLVGVDTDQEVNSSIMSQASAQKKEFDALRPETGDQQQGHLARLRGTRLQQPVR